MPDGVKSFTFEGSNGEKQTAIVKNNVGIAWLPADSVPKSLTWTQPDGSTTTTAVPNETSADPKLSELPPANR